LASDDSFGVITICPGGVVHVHLPHVTVKLLPHEFLKLAELAAHAKVALNAARPPAEKPHLRLVSQEDPPAPPTDSE
jgi:hypothetical protein